MSDRKAACSCGQLQVTVRGDPTRVAMCHCLECQRRTGSTFGVQAFYPRAQVRLAKDASSVAGLMITTEAMVAEAPKKKEPPAMPGNGMGGMDY